MNNSSSKLTITNSVNHGSVKEDDSQDSDGQGVGGIIGLAEKGTVTLSKVANDGKITMDFYGAAGGLIGEINGEVVGKIEESWNEGNVTNNYTSDPDGAIAGGIVGKGSTPLDQVFNTGKITVKHNSGKVGGLVGEFSGTVTNSYNTGDVMGSNDGGNSGGIVGIGWFQKVENTYNTGYIEAHSGGGIVGTILNGTVTNSYNLGKVGSNESTTTAADIANAQSSWSIDKAGGNSSAVWRLYQDKDNPTDKNRQPLLTAFMQGADVTRYTTLTSAGTKKIADLVQVSGAQTYTVHNSDGSTYKTRYLNSGKDYSSSDNFVKYKIVDGSSTISFSVNNNKYYAEASLYSTQFGYNFSFDKDSDSDWKNVSGGKYSDIDAKISTAGNKAADNAVYLRIGEIAAQTVTVNVTINVTDRTKDADGNLNTISGNGYTVTGDSGYNVIEGLLSGQVEVVEKGGEVTLKYKNGSTLPSTYTSGGKEYKITKNSDGKYTVSTTDTATNTTTNYIVTLNNGSISSVADKAISVTVKVGNGTLNDGVFADTGYTVGDTTIAELLKNVKVTYIGDDTILTNLPSKLVSIGNNQYTYTVTNSDGTKTVYTITIKPGDLRIYNTPKETETTDTTPTDTTPTDTTTPTTDTTTPSTPSTPSSSGGGGTVTVTEPTVDNVSVLVTVGDGTLIDGVFSNNGYTVGNTTIAELLNGATVTYTSDGKTILTNLPSSLVSLGNDQYRYTVTDPDGNRTIYTVTIDPGDLSKLVNTDVIISVGDGSLIDGVFTDTGYTVGNPIIADLLNNVTVIYDEPTRTTRLTNLPAGLTSIGGNQYTYTVTDPDGSRTVYTITIDPGALSIYNTPVEPTVEIVPKIEVTPVVEVTPTVETVSTDVDDPDVELRSSNMEDFGGEKGDYVDLDLQDHTLIETKDTNVAVDELNATPEEFSAEASRNIVNRDGMELTSIADVSTEVTDGVNVPADFNATDNANIGGNIQAGGEIDGGLSSLDSTDNNSSVGRNNGRGSRNENSFSGGRSANNRNSNGLSNTSNSSNNSRGNSASNRNSSGNRSTNSTSNNDSGSDNSDSSRNASESNENNGELGAVESGRSDSQQGNFDSNSTSGNKNSQGKKSDNKKSNSQNDSEDQDSDDEEEDKESDEGNENN